MSKPEYEITYNRIVFAKLYRAETRGSFNSAALKDSILNAKLLPAIRTELVQYEQSEKFPDNYADKPSHINTT
ncbi:25808_t:CDS:2 [Gigaspora margarita]|uniref:25808_t:CDS:1 n=1 Tax=Gigaspora margarita TaxID=4874 RepID=A0ABN7UEC9_GIGMA|nr:25808_t:CDS:2 [Gigaspora margarita]